MKTPHATSLYKTGTGAAYHPLRKEAGKTGRRFHLGDSTQVFDAKVYVIYQALWSFESQDKHDTANKILSDSMAALHTVQTD